jgi:hypothetical protein
VPFLHFENRTIWGGFGVPECARDKPSAAPRSHVLEAGRALAITVGGFVHGEQEAATHEAGPRSRGAERIGRGQRGVKTVKPRIWPGRVARSILPES